MEEPWTEKYRPKKLDEIIGRDYIVARLKSYVQSRSMPHLLFAGPAGVGKTTSAICLARELFGEYWTQNFQETNASDERGIDVVRNKIKDFARTKAMGGDFKIIFLDEADALTPDAQNALRRTMELFARTCRFILSCNYSSKIIEPIQSRCAVFRFGPLSEDAIKKMIEKIAENEELNLTETGKKAIIYVSEGDMRKAINILQAAAFLEKDIDEELVYQVAAKAKPAEIKEMMHLALKGEFLKARNKLDTLLLKYGLSGEDILRQMHREVFSLDIDEEKKVKIIDMIGDHDFRLVEGSNERIQIEALIAKMTVI
ncbi:MAG TPA: replication factor C small subunit [Methanomicrobia archaeon]|nr:replication factor C small subunit [Methanomicrobia archaeon]